MGFDEFSPNALLLEHGVDNAVKSEDDLRRGSLLADIVNEDIVETNLPRQAIAKLIDELNARL